ncbi:MAG: methionyl-tRNA formyltransferase [Firmicutes bacterium]|nr:methionyl-tRNA formyltransferase [Bacillota bacterium]
MNLEKLNPEKKLKIIFMGTPDFAVPVLKALDDNYKVSCVITQPDRMVGRKQEMVHPPVKVEADKRVILTLQPEKIKDVVEEVKHINPDLIVTCAYGQIVPKEILDIPRLGCINVHASLLPKLRGGAPIHRAIMDGHSKTGITIMYMNEKMDDGDIISQVETPILDTDTASSLHDKLSVLGAKLLIETLPSIINGTNSRTKQNRDEVTFAFTIKREDERIDFSKTKRDIHNQIRGLNSWPGAYCLYEGKILKVWNSYVTDNYFPAMFDGQITNIYDNGFGVKVSNGEIVFTEVQLEGKNKMSAKEFLNGVNKEEFIGRVLD